MTEAVGSVPIRVVVVDDDPIVRGALRNYLATAPDLQVIGECADGLDVVTAAATLQADVVLMDIRMPGLDGITATRRLRQGRVGARVLLLTALEADADWSAGFEAGADGLLLKSESPEAIVNAVRAVHWGAAVVPRDALRTRQPERPAAGAASALTQRELEVLGLLCRAQSNAEIGATLFLSESTVKSHVSAIMTKLGVRSRLKAVVRAHELGLVQGG